LHRSHELKLIDGLVRVFFYILAVGSDDTCIFVFLEKKEKHSF
jgi:hypothetical protein